jgi:hypothetical protein
LTGNKVTLHSHKKAGADFPVTLEENRGNGYTIRVMDKNPYLRQYVTALYFRGEQEDMASSDAEGVISIPEENVDRIYLRHEIYPDIACLLKDQQNSHNYFEVTLSPSLAEVSFQGIDFMLEENTLTCLPNYFLPFQHIRFVKE